MKNLLLVMVLVACLVGLTSCAAPLTALKVAGHAVSFVSPKVVKGLGSIPQVGAVNAKQVKAVNAAHNVATGSIVPQIGATSAVGIASNLTRLIP